MKQENNKFTWGDPVVIIKSAPKEFRPGEAASICGFYKTKSSETSEQFTRNIEEWIYTVEFEDGSDIQVSERYLEKNPEIVRGKELSKYSHHFVNGVVLEIKLNISSVEILVKSTSIHQEISDDFLLSNENCFKGKIIALQIEKTTVQNSSGSMGWQKEGNILSFEISDNILKLSIGWDRSKTTSLELKSGQIWWEKQT